MDTPILGRLVDQGSVPSGGIAQCKGCGESDRISGLDNKSRQVRADSDSSVFFCGIQIPSKLGPSEVHSQELAKKI